MDESVPEMPRESKLTVFNSPSEPVPAWVGKLEKDLDQKGVPQSFVKSYTFLDQTHYTVEDRLLDYFIKQEKM